MTWWKKPNIEILTDKDKKNGLKFDDPYLGGFKGITPPKKRKKK
jgi:hypothetical protein